MQTRLLGAALAVSTLCASALADRVAPGFEILSTEAPPVAFASYKTLDNGNVVSWDGENCDVYGPTGALVSSLGSTGNGFAFPSFIVLDPAETFAVVGESSNNLLYKVDLTGGGFTNMGVVVFNFAATFETANTIIVSAATGGFNSPNELVRVHTDTFQQTSLGFVPGPSGPVAVNSDGDLFYVTQDPGFPPPPGSSRLVTWSAAQLSGGTIDETNWEVFVKWPFDGGSSLAIDPVTDDVFVAESIFNFRPNEIIHVRADGKVLGPIATVDALTVGNLEFISGPGAGHFAAYQPAGGVRLVYHSTDFGAIDQMVHVEPRRPELTLSGPGLTGIGQVELSIQGGAPLGEFMLLADGQSSLTANELTYDLGLGFLVHSRLPFATLQSATTSSGPNNFFGQLFDLDEDGEGSVTFFNNGSWNGAFGFQGLILEGRLGMPVGTTATVTN